jgi:hypothetical protein
VSKQPSESQIKAHIREYFGLRPDMRLFNNPVGEAPTDYGGRIKFGLAPGSSDLIGWINRCGIAVFLALEVKDHNGRPTREQLAFIDTVRAGGGIAGVVRSVDDVRRLLGELE